MHFNGMFQYERTQALVILFRHSEKGSDLSC